MRELVIKLLHPKQKLFIKECISLFNKTLWWIKFLIRKNKLNTSGLNNNLNVEFSTLTNCKININGNNNRIFIEQGANISNLRLNVNGNNHTLKIGNCFIEQCNISFEETSNKIVIGNNTTIVSANILARENDTNITIGEDCALASEIDIRNSDSHSIIDLNSNKRINFAKDISIGNHVWIGRHVRILKGVNIGNNSIVGMNSIVTKDMPNNCIIAGIPAKVVKTNISWERELI